MVGVGRVNSSRADLVEELTFARDGVRQFDDIHDLGAAEAGDLHGSHGVRLGPAAIVSAPWMQSAPTGCTGITTTGPHRARRETRRQPRHQPLRAVPASHPHPTSSRPCPGPRFRTSARDRWPEPRRPVPCSPPDRRRRAAVPVGRQGLGRRQPLPRVRRPARGCSRHPCRGITPAAGRNPNGHPRSADLPMPFGRPRDWERALPGVGTSPRNAQKEPSPAELALTTGRGGCRRS